MMLSTCRRFATAAGSLSSPRTGIVMLNMGGPSSSNVDQVHEYLHKIMTDRDMIQFPVMQDRLGPWIAKRRAPEVAKKYAEIGGGSSIHEWTNRQGSLLVQRLDQVSPETGPHKYYVAFRYVNPDTEAAFDAVLRDGVERVVLFSQYPQYSCATSGSSFNAVAKHFKKQDFPNNIKMSIIDRWATHPLLVKCFADLIRKELAALPEHKRADALILFSAHSLPIKTVNRGDSYPSEIGATVHAVMDELQYCNAHQLVWQSKVGPMPWLGPFTDDSLKDYVTQGKKTFLIVPIAFVNEHIETLHELDIEYCQELIEEIGDKEVTVRRVPAPNDHPLFVDALSDLVVKNLASKSAVSQKFLNRCPHCVNQNCLISKKWYAQTCK